MDSLIIYFLPTILALGIVTSWEDIKEGKIRNKYIIAGISLATIIYAILIMTGIINLEYLTNLVIVAAISLIIGALLWLGKFWSAGDSKLFFVYSLFIPIKNHSYADLFNYPAATIINSIIPVFIYIVVKTSTGISFAEIKDMARKSFRLKPLAISLLSVFSLSWVIRVLFFYLNIEYSYVLSFVLLVLIYRLALKNIDGLSTLAILVFISIIRIVIDGKHLVSWPFLTSFLVFTLAFIITTNFLNQFSEKQKKKISIEQLKEGMELSTKLTENLKKTQKNKNALELNYSALSKKDIRKINKLSKGNKISVYIEEKIPFAPFLFFGTIATILINGNIISFLRGL